MTTKNVSYRGVKAELPQNVSISSFKDIVDMCGGFINLVQPMLNLLSNKLYPLQNRKNTL